MRERERGDDDDERVSIILRDGADGFLFCRYIYMIVIIIINERREEKNTILYIVQMYNVQCTMYKSWKFQDGELALRKRFEVRRERER